MQIDPAAQTTGPINGLCRGYRFFPVEYATQHQDRATMMNLAKHDGKFKAGDWL